MQPIFFKDPDAKLDYLFDWSKWLDGDTISASSFIVPAGLNKESDSHTMESSIVWLSGGSEGKTYSVVNRIKTAAGRIDDRTMIIVARSK